MYDSSRLKVELHLEIFQCRSIFRDIGYESSRNNHAMMYLLDAQVPLAPHYNSSIRFRNFLHSVTNHYNQFCVPVSDLFHGTNL